MSVTGSLRRFITGKVALARTMREVRRSTGKGVLPQVREIARLRLGTGRLRVSDYYAYELFDDTLYPGDAKGEVVGWNGAGISERLNDPHWRAVASDKFICYALLKGLDLPHPGTYALYHGHGRAFGTAPTLTTPESVAAFLRESMPYPFFAKPVAGQHGDGASAVARMDRSRDMLTTVPGEEIPVEDYVARYVVPESSGYLFQEMLRPHAEIRRMCGNKVSTVRVIVLNAGGERQVFRALWRIPVGNNITDNFLHGTSGNLMAYVDPATGLVRRAIRGPGNDTTRLYGHGRRGRRLELHPETGERLEGIRLPAWQETFTLCQRAAAAFPGLRYQSWDIAMCEQGPVLVELNSSGDLMQMPGCPGFFDSQFQQFVAAHARKPG